MARTPKAASTPAAPPAPRGRKPKAAAALPEPVAAATDDEDAGSITADAELPLPGNGSAKGRGGRKPKKQAAAPEMAAEPQADEAPPAASEDDAVIAEMAYPVSAGEDTAPVTEDQASEPEPEPAPASSAEAAQAQPAAQWDRATDTVRFDWPAIEQTASQAGPNQAMAKLLVAARAEGASSRWPF